MPFANKVGILLAVGLVAGCGGGPSGPEGASAPHAMRPSTPVSDTPVRIGPAYTVGGVTYTPEDVADYDAVGYASWYGGDLEGRSTANGEILNPAAVSGAHRTLPLPSYVEVTALNSGRTILVRINDRGPFSGNRIIDLSAGAAEQLGIAGNGAEPVRVRRVSPSEADKALLRTGGRAPERIGTPEDLLAVLRKQLPAMPPSALPPPPSRGSRPPPASRPAAPPPARATPPAKAPGTPAAKASAFMVQVATFSSRDRADVAAKKVGATVQASNDLFRVRLGPFASEAAARAAIASAAAKGYPGGRIVTNDTP